MSGSQLRPPLLLALAARLPASEPAQIVGWLYRRDLGAWVDADDRTALMVLAADPPPKPTPKLAPKPASPPATPKPRPMSKKFDHETGEDMKGE